MHYRPEIVRSDIIAISDVLVEVVFATALNIRPHDPHEPVTILATLFMPQTYRMPDFANCGPEAAPATQ